MTTSADTRTNDEEISLIAFEIWESEGRPDGRDKEHWYLAKERVAGGEDEKGETAFEDSGDLGAQADEVQNHTYVRPAGRRKMDIPPSTWSKTDEEVDESFPASDPPGNY